MMLPSAGCLGYSSHTVIVSVSSMERRRYRQLCRAQQGEAILPPSVSSTDQTPAALRTEPRPVPAPAVTSRFYASEMLRGEMEEELELELNNISLDGGSPGESDDESGTLPEYGEGEIIDELPESIISCLQFLKQRGEHAERLILQDLETEDSWTELIPAPPRSLYSDVLVQLASEYNEDPKTFFKRALADIEEDDKTTGDNSENAHSQMGDGSHEVIRLCYVEVEESCRQKLQQWEKEQEKLNELERAALSARKTVIEKEIQEQDEKRANWKKEFEKELLRLNTLQKEQQEKLNDEIKRKSDAITENQKEHQNLITKLEMELVNERNIFEKKKAEEKKYLKELQNKSAMKIQATFRAYRVYKIYSPILKQKMKDLARKREIQEKMDQERKQLEEKVKHKLEEKKKKEEEKRLYNESVKKQIEEEKSLEYEEQKRRQQEYEDKKKDEKQRLEKAKILKQESKVKLDAVKSTDTFNSECVGEGARDNSKNSHLCLEINQKRLEDRTNSQQKQAHIDILVIEKNTLEQTEVKHDMQQANVGTFMNNKVMQTDLESISRSDAPTDHCLSGLVEESSKKLEIVASSILQASFANRAEDIVVPFSHAHSNSVLHEDNMSGNAADPYQISEVALSSEVTEETTCGDVQSEPPNLPMTSRSLVLPDDIEVKRLDWMKSCTPWSKIIRETRKKSVIRKTRQGKSSAARKLPPLNETVILRHGPWNSLKQVTTVTLCDLPGCSLSTLSTCEKLKYLSLQRCGLTILDGISNCKQLQYIDVQDNCIKAIICEDLENLAVLLLNKNQVTSIHGLDNCTNLISLELSFNLITRISGLDSLHSLQRLVLDHNQLMSTSGLETTSMLTYLDCSYNYLTELEGIQSCGLLQILKLQGNNLSEIPKLDNHVLLREIYLDDNNLTTLGNMSSYWLPLLQHFSAAKNSLTHLASLYSFISLECIDLSSNCLSELQVVLQWLDGCVSLSRLSVNKNPFLQEVNWRSALLEKLPMLRFLNDEEIQPKDDTPHKPTPGSFLALCQDQILAISKLWQIIHIEGSNASLDCLDLYCNALKKLLKLSVEHRYAHEYGDMAVSQGEDLEILKGHASPPALDRSLQSGQVTSDVTSDEDTRINPQRIILKQINPPTLSNNKKDNLAEESRISTIHSHHLAYSNSGSSLKTFQTKESIKIRAAIRIQSQWRGYVVRRDIRYYSELHEAASIIQSAWRHYYRKKKLCAKPDALTNKKQAATVIQAAWKGFFLRKKLAAAFAAIEREEPEDDFEEVNLEHFTFDENDLEKDWRLDCTAFHYEPIHLPSKADRVKKCVIPEVRAQSFPRTPQEAWAGSDAASLLSGRISEKQESRISSDVRLDNQNLSHVSSMKSNTDVSFRSEKEEKISQEWGLKDSATVKLMLKRAQKMQSKQAKHKRMSDPAVRLALFKNNENKHTPVTPPKKTPPKKKTYFQGIEEESSISSETLSRSRELTYHWLHTQCGDVESTCSDTLKPKHFLPGLNHEVLNGGRVQLVANKFSREAEDLDLVSVKSGSTLSHNRDVQRTTSSSSTLSNVSAPVKINSGPQRKQRISFRDNPVQLSGGWGGGKKTGKAFK